MKQLVENYLQLWRVIISFTTWSGEEGVFWGICPRVTANIYTSWDKCKKQVDGFKGNEYKGFMVRHDAEACDYLTVVGEGSSGFGSNAMGLLPSELGLDVVPKVDPTEFIIMEDLEHLLFRTCAQLQVGPPVFFLRDGAKKYAAFITLERLLEEIGMKIFDFNYLMALCMELQQVSRWSLADRVAELEKENAELKQRLGLYNAVFCY
ncbi:uncharacterized protein DS421_18g619940 [Arachis hypogaea]|nr:uncharacterized protein DS421_18g619940 [Arachis hypogaea]